MKIVLTGMSFSGKSTVFKALVGKRTQPKTAASGKLQLNIGTLEVKDKRLSEITRIVNSEKITYPKISLIDLARSKEASSASGIEISYLHEYDALAIVVAAFSGENIIQDFNSIESELILADLQLVQNRIERINKERKGRPQKEEDPELILLQRISRVLEEERFAKDLGLSVEEVKMLAGFQLLTLKPMIVILNVSEDKMNKPNTDLEQHIKSRNLIFFSLCAKLEAEIEELPQEEQPQFLQEMGLDSLSREKFMQICFQAFDFISFFTVVGKEARAWPIPRSSTALKAAGSVHSDMEKGFIRAEVINFKDFIECGSFAKAKENGLLRLESKEYPVQDGDIINFKFSV